MRVGGQQTAGRAGMSTSLQVTPTDHTLHLQTSVQIGPITYFVYRVASHHSFIKYHVFVSSKHTLTLDYQ